MPGTGKAFFHPMPDSLLQLSLGFVCRLLISWSTWPFVYRCVPLVYAVGRLLSRLRNASAPATNDRFLLDFSSIAPLCF